MTVPRRVLVVRHGESAANATGVWQGHLDSPLNERGEAQAAAAAAALADRGIQAVVSSDLQRASRTGEIIAEAAGVPCSTDERLREIHAGRWQGMSGVDVREQFPEEMAMLARGEDFARGIDGESVSQVAVRVRACVDELLERIDPGGTLLVSTHGVSSRALAASLLDLEQMHAWRMLGGLGNCHWGQLGQGSAGWRLLAWNEHAPRMQGLGTGWAMA